MPSHTPGPWRVEQPYRARAYVMSLANQTVAICDATRFEADARLIAAAPDLLEALQQIVREVGAAPVTGEGRAAALGRSAKIARTAISKATDDERLRTLGHKRA